MNKIKLLLNLLIPIVLFTSCEKDLFEEQAVAGLWKQVSISEDGVEMALTPEQQACKMLIEMNGIYRVYHQSFMNYNMGNGPTTFYGTWSLLDDQWLNLSTDKWKFIPSLTTDSSKVVLSYGKDQNGVSSIDTLASVKKQWNKYHIQSRFTILQLSDTQLQIRLKTFEGEKKYALLFAPDPADFIEYPLGSNHAIYIPKLVTDDNYWAIRKEFQTLKTYVFTFTREEY